MKQTSILIILLLFLSVIFIITGCSTTLMKVRNITVDGLVFQNLTDKPVSDMRIWVQKTKTFAVCSYMPPKGQCSTTFPVRQYKGNSVTVTWKQNEKSWSKKDFYVDAPINLNWGAPAKAIINIKEGGELTATLKNN